MRYLLSGAQLILYGKIEGEFTGLRFPKLNESGILTALGNELFLLSSMLPDDYMSESWQSIEATLGLSQVSLIAIAPIAFLAYAYTQLSRSYLTSVGLWLSIAVSMLLLAAGYIYIIVVFRES